MNSKTRALGATLLFAAVGFWSVLFHNVPWEFSVPHIIFYTVLTINTYFSVRFYTAFTPESTFQSAIDFALVAAYIALGLSIGIPLAFAFFALLIFTLAPSKYAHMLGTTPYDATLRKKILIDLLGTLMCVLVLGVTIAGLQLKAAWMLAILFTLANIYLLLIRPMYRHVE
ncbi:MAG: hypothetical protein KBD06_04895 [Candidatus Pacebacteria bacterium]|nr:hypothetical protein [Candidatus Paceibacterota bacterium]